MTDKYWQPGGRVRPVGAPPPGPPHACGMCRGRGYTWVENDQGVATHQVACPFCGGRRDDAWVAEQADQVEAQADRRRGLVGGAAVVSGILFALGWEHVDGGSALAAFSMLLGMIGIFACFCYFFYERGRQRRLYQSQVPPGPSDPFTTPEEVRKVRQAQAAAALGLFLWQLGERHRRH